MIKIIFARHSHINHSSSSSSAGVKAHPICKVTTNMTIFYGLSPLKKHCPGLSSTGSLMYIYRRSAIEICFKKCSYSWPLTCGNPGDKKDLPSHSKCFWQIAIIIQLFSLSYPSHWSSRDSLSAPGYYIIKKQHHRVIPQSAAIEPVLCVILVTPSRRRSSRIN